MQQLGGLYSLTTPKERIHAMTRGRSTINDPSSERQIVQLYRLLEGDAQDLWRTCTRHSFRQIIAQADQVHPLLLAQGITPAEPASCRVEGTNLVRRHTRRKVCQLCHSCAPGASRLISKSPTIWFFGHCAHACSLYPISSMFLGDQARGTCAPCV